MDGHAFEALRLLINPGIGFAGDEFSFAEAPGKAAIDPATGLALPQMATPQATMPADVSLNQVEAYVHRATELNAAQQYLSLEAVASADPTQNTSPDQLADALALEMLLAQNGSLFNGAVGGLIGTNSPSDTQAAAAALLRRKSELEQRNRRVRGVSMIGTDLELGEFDDDTQDGDNADRNPEAYDDESDFDDDMAFLDAALSTPLDNYEAELGSAYTSYTERPGGVIS